jgi:hypothetical protein
MGVEDDVTTAFAADGADDRAVVGMPGRGLSRGFSSANKSMGLQ